MRLVWYHPQSGIKHFDLCRPDSWNMVPLVELIGISLRGSCHMCGEGQRLHRSVTLVPGQDRNCSGAAQRHKGGLAGWGVKEEFLTQFTPSPASLYLLPHLYHVTHGTMEWHLRRSPKGSSCLTAGVLAMLPSQPPEPRYTASNRELIPPDS